MPPDENKIPVPSAREFLLRVSGVRKAFPGVQALKQVAFDLRPGEVHALVGENGAGKSTLIKILTGVHHADAGEVLLDGRPIEFSSPQQARQAGIAAIHQELALIPAMTVAANLFLGREPTRRGLVDRKQERQRAREVFKRLGVDFDADTRVDRLTVAQQQLLEIARALLVEARIIVMDEPTAALTPREVERLFVILRELVSRQIGIIFISHRLDEVFAIADRITVLRDGETVVTAPASELSRRRLIEYMVGRPLDEEFPKVAPTGGKVRLEVSNLTGAAVHDVTFAARGGEVLGIAGLMGSGRTEVARLIFGADRKSGGEILLDGRRLDIAAPRDAIAHGISLLTEDRKSEGLILVASANDNFALSNLARWSKLSFINRRHERSRFEHHRQLLSIRVSSPEQRAAFLSGGNQQKLLVARWLERDAQVIIFDEPTRGIDVGAKYEMYLVIRQLAAQGKVVIVISSELPEILAISDRILVMRRGRLAGEISDVTRATQEDVMVLSV